MTPTIPYDNSYTEDALIERPSVDLLKSLGWQTTNLFAETFGASGTEGRKGEREVVLSRRLRAALESLNPALPPEAFEQAIEELTRDRSAMLPVNANREFYQLIKDGVRVTVRQSDGSNTYETLRVIDWTNPTNNDFFLASQLWVAGDLYRRRTDLVGFVNGLPLLFIELKSAQTNLFHAFNDNLRDYKETIPHLFVPNALVVLSNGTDTRVGTLTSEWEHFFEWKRINDEGEQGVISLETVLRGICEPERFLDMVENFIVFEEVRGGLVKKAAKNHQYLGVNRAIIAVEEIRENQGRLGVFWHTQGSGKSLSMVFFTQKVLRKLPGNWTFLVVTDRNELDDQIYKTFAATGAVTEEEAQATSGANLQQLLKEDHRYVFTLIQKFRTESGERYPTLSERSDVIVMTDEAHRSQYDILAMNMRHALPHSAFIGFTGTPLIQGEEERTREVFGDYVSVYNFRRSVEDRATVPLYYENRIPELQLTNADLNSDMEQLLEDAELSEEQERKLEREFGRQYHLITRDDRLDAIADDVVEHFTGRGYKGKAMMICIDKATAVKMYDRVQVRWTAKLGELRDRLATVNDEEREALEALITYMESTDMAVVVSQSQNEIPDLAAKGVDIKPHRERMVKEDLDEKFKDPNSNFRLAFVCAMWITGFDVPTCSTIYLDKPMRNHTLMQTIARANRVAPGKVAGLIVDYVGVFRDLQKALAVYAAAGDGAAPGAGDEPIQDKQALVEELRRMIVATRDFCAGKGIDLEAIKAATGFARVGLMGDAVEALITDTAEKKHFLAVCRHVEALFKAILPDPLAGELAPDAVLISALGRKIRELTPPPDISHVMQQVEELLDTSVAAEGYVIGASAGEELSQSGFVDLSEIDFEALGEMFIRSPHKRTQAERLMGGIAARLARMVALNHSRIDYADKFQKMIEEYNSGSKNVEEFFNELLEFARGLTKEEQRAVSEGLSEEELAVFDILTKPDPTLNKTEEADVKRVAKELLARLKEEKLVIDWRLKQQARADVQETIAELLDRLPVVYTKAVYERKCDLTYRHIYAAYLDASHNIYRSAPAQV